MKLDHLLVAVAHLDAATRTYEAILGVPPAVRSEHPSYGTHNALFLFERGPYFELIAARPGAAPTEYVNAIERFLAARGEGLFGIAFAPRVMEGAVARLRACGCEVADAQHGTGVSAEGPAREWRMTRLPDGVLLCPLAMLIQHEGWDWRAELRRTPLAGRERSAVSAIHHAVLDVPDAEAASAAWEQAFGLRCAEAIDSERMGARVLVHPAGEATLEAVGATTPDGPVAERIRQRGYGLSSVAFSVTDLDAAVGAVRAAGIAVTDPAPGVLPRSRVGRIEPASACGVAAQLIEFI